MCTPLEVCSGRLRKTLPENSGYSELPLIREKKTHSDQETIQLKKKKKSQQVIVKTAGGKKLTGRMNAIKIFLRLYCDITASDTKVKKRNVLVEQKPGCRSN